MPIHEKKRMPKSDHYILKYGDWKFGQGNASAHILHQPPIRISSPQGKIEVHKHVCADATCIYADEIFIFKYFFPRPCGRDQCPHRREFFFFFFFFFDTLPRAPRPRGRAWVCTDGVLPHVDAVKARLQVKLRLGGKNGRMRSSGR
jgi:hypothetical protein